ncbi:T6SS effector BTH_I2691 family protein, partial [Paraburkholderia tropica]|uniref:T6SS effector BTH_I2691 family protein n=1 Tax=Paraburkholderia tropica TaxID=92647 RepID=UPI002F90F5BA
MANTPLTCSKTCQNCMKSGLAILPVRYAVVPATMSDAMPSGIVGPGTLDVKLSAHHYSLRTLREGWLYLFYEKGARGSNYWEVYRVTEDGRLWKQGVSPTPPVLVPSQPVTDPACAQGGGAVPMDVIAIEKPEKATRVFVAFSEYPWTAKVFDRYSTDAALRSDRMQLIMPSAWIQTGSGVFGMKKGACGHAVPVTQAGIDRIVEYQPALKPALLSPPASPIASDATGRATDDTIWQQEATRYPLHIRQSSPGSASKDLAGLMDRIGENASGTPYKPMLLALWDGVGITHELAGFHNDPAAVLM